MFCRFQGVQHNRFRGVGCPFWGHSCFPKKGFAEFGTCNRRFWPKMAQTCIIICADVPFLDILIFNLNVLPFWGDATLCAFSWHARMHKCMTPYMLTKKWKKSPCQIWQILSFCYHFWYHLENALLHTRKVGIEYRVACACAKISCLNLANIIILLSLLLITFNKRNAPVGAFF